MQTRCFSRTRHPALIAPSRPSITHPRIRSCCLPLADSSLIGNPMIPVVLAVVLLLVSVIVYRFVWVPYSIVRKLRAQGLKVKSPESRVLVSSSFPPQILTTNTSTPARIICAHPHPHTHITCLAPFCRRTKVIISHSSLCSIGTGSQLCAGSGPTAAYAERAQGRRLLDSASIDQVS